MRMLFIAVPALLYAASLADWKLLRTLNLRAETGHVQGIDFDARRLWVTSVDRAKSKGYLHEFDLATGEQMRSVAVEQGIRFHPGGIAADRRSLWLPVAEYRRESSATIQKRSQRT